MTNRRTITITLEEPEATHFQALVGDLGRGSTITCCSGGFAWKVEKLWIEIDIGRHAHHAAAVDDSGAVLWSRRIRNDQAEIETLLERVADVESLVWAIDMTAPESSCSVACCTRTISRCATCLAGSSTV